MLTVALVAGLAFLVLELVVPGLVLVFLGAGALLVALLIWLGLLTSWVTALIAWFISSLALLLGLRGLVVRLFPGEEETQSTDEELDALERLDGPPRRPFVRPILFGRILGDPAWRWPH